MFRKLALLIALAGSLAASAQSTQIVAHNIEYFGGQAISGQFCVSATDQTGAPVNLETSAGQQVADGLGPACFPITNGVLASTAIVPDTSLAQPVNACYKVTIFNSLQQQVATYRCIQPSGATWSFDSYVPSSLPNIPALLTAGTSLGSITLASNATIASTTLASTGLVLPAVPPSTTVHGHCMMFWEQLNTAVPMRFGVTVSTAPIATDVLDTISYGADDYQYTAVGAATAATPVTPAVTPAGVGTTIQNAYSYKNEMDITLINSGTGTPTVTIDALTTNAADPIIVLAGSYCAWL